MTRDPTPTRRPGFSYLRKHAIPGTVSRVTQETTDSLERYRLHAEVCKVLTDPKRLMLLDALRRGDRSVGELAQAIGAALPNASQHLAVLRNAGLVGSRRMGATVVYRLAEPEIGDACDVIGRIVMKRLAARHSVAPGGDRTMDASHGVSPPRPDPSAPVQPESGVLA